MPLDLTSLDDVPRPLEEHYRLRSRPEHNLRTYGTLGGLLLTLGLIVGLSQLRWLGSWSTVAMLALLLGVVLLFSRRQRGGAVPPDALQRLEQGGSLLRSGDLGAAAATLDRLAPQLLRAPWYQAVAAALRAAVALRQGESEQALRLGAEVLRSRWGELPAMALYLGQAPGLVAVIRLVRGEAERAERLLQALPAQPPSGARLFAEALLHARAGRWAACAEGLRAGWGYAEGQLGPAEVKALRLLLALALERQGAPPGDLEVRRLVLGVRPCWPGQFDYLVPACPPLGPLLREHGLAARPEAAAS